MTNVCTNPFDQLLLSGEGCEVHESLLRCEVHERLEGRISTTWNPVTESPMLGTVGLYIEDRYKGQDRRISD